jgi:WD40 repeat protein
MISVQTYTQMESAVRTLSFSHDGDLIASGGQDKFIDISYS